MVVFGSWGRLARRLGAVRSALERYSGLVHQIKEKGKERKSLLAEKEKKCAAELNDALKQYAELKEQAADLDPDELLAARLAHRPERERSAASRLQTAYGDEFKAVTLYDSKLDVRNMLGERAERPRKEALQRREKGRDGYER